MIDQLISYSFFLPVPLVLVAGLIWYRSRARMPTRRRRVVTATCFALCAVSAFLIPVLFSVLSLLPNDNPDMRFLVLLRSLQVGLPCALAGLVLIPFAAKGGRVLACTAALLLLGQWYELGQIF